MWFGNTELITVERACGGDENGALRYNSAEPSANTYIRISGITAALSPSVTALTLHCDSRASVRVLAALRTEGMTDFSQETELTDSGDSRGFHGVIGNTSMTKAYFVRIRAVDCYGQETATVKLSSAPLSEDFPTVFKAKAKTREAEFWWPVTFCGGLKAVRTDGESAITNLSDRYTPGLYYTEGALNGVNTQVVYESGLVLYSEMEQDTGLTWIDGKRVYQKTVVFPLEGNVEEIVPLPTGAETVIGFEGAVVNDEDGRIVFPLNFSDLNSYQYLYVQVSGTSIMGFDFEAPKILVETSLSLLGYTLYLTVRYTKGEDDS